MENRLSKYFDGGEKPMEEQPMVMVELKQGERLLKLTLELEDKNGLLDDEMPEGFEGEAFIEEEIIVREREFETFTRVLHYNRTRYRVETLR